MDEKTIHSIIKTHPYLLGEDFSFLFLQYEFIYPDLTRSDFIFSNKNVAFIVEVKYGSLDFDAIKQIEGYLENEKNKHPQKDVNGILVGNRPHNEDSFNEEIVNCIFDINLLYLDEDIPTIIKLCGMCRRANFLFATKCKYCKSRQFLKDPFLFNRNIQRL